MLSKTTQFIPFESPTQLLSFYDEDLLNGRYKLHQWQRNISKEIARIPNDGEINEIDLVTNNGSGKSQIVVSPSIAYFATQFDKSQVILTSASGSQVDNQTGRFLKSLAQRMNSYHKKDLWKIQYRKLHFEPTDAYVDIFATDEGTKAEGWHPREFGSAFAKVVDEAKAVEDNIFEALDRCSGAQWYLRVSSPRIGTTGYFYKKLISGVSKVFKITAYDCPHISLGYINGIIATYGLHSPITRSIIFAEFTSIDESLVITREKILELINNPPLVADGPISVGCDMAMGGDENVITWFKGNKQQTLRAFRERDTVQTKNLIVEILGSWGIPKDCPHLNFDDGHVGHSIIDMLWREGWNIKRKVNQSSAIRLPDMYANRGAEMWWSFSNFVNNREIQLLNDQSLIDQLGSRYYTQSGIGSKIKLESKLEARSKGHASPDRADATILALSDFQSPFFGVINNTEKPQPTKITQNDVIEFMDQLKYSKAFGQLSRESKGQISIASILERSEIDLGDRFSEMDEILRLNRTGK